MENPLNALLNRTRLTAQGRFRDDVEREKASLDRAHAATAAEPAPPALVGLDERKATWQIATRASEPCFMSLALGSSNERHVVEVSADKFYRAWLNRPAQLGDKQRSDDCLLRSEMASDYKFPHAAAGFAHGRENPVPLATCSCEVDKNGRPEVSFENGVTRTFWLLAHQAESFPVEVRSLREARTLHRAAGLGAAPVSVAALVDAARQQGVVATAKPEHAQAVQRVARSEHRVPTTRGPRVR